MSTSRPWSHVWYSITKKVYLDYEQNDQIARIVDTRVLSVEDPALGGAAMVAEGLVAGGLVAAGTLATRALKV